MTACAPMIPEQVAALVASPSWAHAGTRDAKLVPAVHNIVVAFLPDGERATVLVPEFCQGKLESNLADNGWFALTVGTPAHESYQLKGHVEEIRDATADEAKRIRGYLDWVKGAMAHYGVPEAAISMIDRIKIENVRAVTFRVEEAYDQTPGPGAGKRLM
jgi:hypothetical protein